MSNQAELFRAIAREEHMKEKREQERRCRLEALAEDLVRRYGREEALRILGSCRPILCDGHG